MTNTSTSAQDAKMGGCTSATANTQKTITLNKDHRDNIREFLFDIQMEGFWKYFKTQPVAIAVLARYLEHYASEDPNSIECQMLTEFIESISEMNNYIYNIIESRHTIETIDELILSFPVVDDDTK